MDVAMPTIASLLIGVGLLASLSRQWRLPAKETAALIMLASLGAGAVAALLAWGGLPRGVLPVLLWTSQVSLFVGSMLLLFYRDPERTPPPDARAVLSPADGTVIYLRRLPAGAALRVEKRGKAMGLGELDQTRLAREELWQVGISMVFTDVHINRAPITGRVAMVHRRPGLFLSLRRPEAASDNERQTILIEGRGLSVAVVQVASRLVRRIQAFVAEGDPVRRGQRIGAIRFGSQVDLLVPRHACSEPLVTPGQRVTAGETVICRLKAAPEEQAGGHG